MLTMYPAAHTSFAEGGRGLARNLAARLKEGREAAPERFDAEGLDKLASTYSWCIALNLNSSDVRRTATSGGRNQHKAETCQRDAPRISSAALR